METISYPVSKRMNNYLAFLLLFVRAHKNLPPVIYYKQKLPSRQSGIYSTGITLGPGDTEGLMTGFLKEGEYTRLQCGDARQ